MFGEWEKVKGNNDAIQNIMEEEPAPAKAYRASYFNVSNAASTSQTDSLVSDNPSVAIPSTAAQPGRSFEKNNPNEGSAVSNYPVHLTDREVYLSSHEIQLTKVFLEDIGFEDHDSFFPSDILCDESLMKMFFPWLKTGIYIF